MLFRAYAFGGGSTSLGLIDTNNPKSNIILSSARGTNTTESERGISITHVPFGGILRRRPVNNSIILGINNDYISAPHHITAIKNAVYVGTGDYRVDLTKIHSGIGIGRPQVYPTKGLSTYEFSFSRYDSFANIQPAINVDNIYASVAHANISYANPTNDIGGFVSIGKTSDPSLLALGPNVTIGFDNRHLSRDVRVLPAITASVVVGTNNTLKTLNTIEGSTPSGLTYSTTDRCVVLGRHNDITTDNTSNGVVVIGSRNTVSISHSRDGFIGIGTIPTAITPTFTGETNIAMNDLSMCRINGNTGVETIYFEKIVGNGVVDVKTIRQELPPAGGFHVDEPTMRNATGLTIGDSVALAKLATDETPAQAMGFAVSGNVLSVGTHEIHKNIHGDPIVGESKSLFNFQPSFSATSPGFTGIHPCYSSCNILPGMLVDIFEPEGLFTDLTRDEINCKGSAVNTNNNGTEYLPEIRIASDAKSKKVFGVVTGKCDSTIHHGTVSYIIPALDKCRKIQPGAAKRDRVLTIASSGEYCVLSRRPLILGHLIYTAGDGLAACETHGYVALRNHHIGKATTFSTPIRSREYKKLFLRELLYLTGATLFN